MLSCLLEIKHIWKSKNYSKLFFYFSFGVGKVEVEAFLKKKILVEDKNRLCKRLSQCQAPFKQKRTQFLGNSTDYPYKSLILEIGDQSFAQLTLYFSVWTKYHQCTQMSSLFYHVSVDIGCIMALRVVLFINIFDWLSRKHPDRQRR